MLDKKKGVLFVIFSLGNGGTQRMMQNILNQCDLNNLNKILYLYNNTKDNSFEHMIEAEITKYITPETSSPFRIIKRFYTLLKIVKKENINTIITFSSQATFLAVLLKKLLFLKRIIIISRLGAMYNQQYVDSKDKRFKYYFWKWVTLNYSYKNSDKIICLTEAMKEDLIINNKALNKNTLVINNYVDVNKVKVMSKESQVDFSNYFITVGRLEEQKNIIGLIKAFSKIKDRIDKNLLILGDGSQKTELEKQLIKLKCQDRVKLLGFKKNPYKYIYNADFFIMNSLYEGMSNAILEALACKVPVLTTNHEGVEDLIIDRFNGLIIPINDENRLSDAMIELLENNRLRDTLIKNGEDSLRKFTGVMEEYSNLILGVSN